MIEICLQYVSNQKIPLDDDCDILKPCMFEDIYRIYTGVNLKTEDGRIPADTYELATPQNP
ncbi:MAG: hypothetical protein K2H52_03885 [Lachnospiraceae bacterium]|nr:hypothetical protein [Lachnospiraceae bacterium]MDE6186028.1 hypothetical protein [Lachnospiraceae bacterium]